ncbi:MAG: DUF2062 domain-containing protein [Myxococcaceae bacterium]|nr:DUF2062 domain-containing protein [Myxococcaceae bacterium]
MPDVTATPPLPWKGLTRWVIRAWRQLKREQLEPRRFGVAVGVGIFFGLSPFLGFQMLAAQVLAVVFRLNKLAVAAAVSISAPPFLPFEVLASVQLGQRLLYGTWAPLTLDEVRAKDALELAKFWGSSYFVGALIFAAVCAVPAGLIATSRMKKANLHKRPELTIEALEALDDALPKLSRKHRLYVAWKVRLDPVYPMVLPALVGRQTVVDLGAGLGVLALFLKQASPDTHVRCVEWDEKKAAGARLLLGDRAEVVSADARTVELGSPDAIVMLDVLHYCPVAEQRAWLERCVKALRPGGVLVVRELDLERGVTATRVEEGAVRRGWNKGGGVYPHPIAELQTWLESLGLKVTRTPVGRGLFRANSMLVAAKGQVALTPVEPTSTALL